MNILNTNEVIDFNVVYKDNQSFRLSVVVC